MTSTPDVPRLTHVDASGAARMVDVAEKPVSVRASAGVYEDRSGPILVAGLRALGLEVPDATIVPDGDAVRAALLNAVRAGVDVILTTGGTGLARATSRRRSRRRLSIARCWALPSGRGRSPGSPSVVGPL